MSVGVGEEPVLDHRERGSADLIRTRPLDSGFSAQTKMSCQPFPRGEGGFVWFRLLDADQDVVIEAVRRAVPA